MTTSIATPTEVLSSAEIIGRIKKIVAEVYSTPVFDIDSRKRTREICEARHVSMHLSCSCLAETYAFVGKHHGGRDHGTVLHANKKVENDMENVPGFKEKYRHCLHMVEKILIPPQRHTQGLWNEFLLSPTGDPRQRFFEGILSVTM